MCACEMQPLCGFCVKPIHRCREVSIPYGAKEYHKDCWEKLRHVARRTGGSL